MIRTRRNRVLLVLGLATAVDLAGIAACQKDLDRPPPRGCSGPDDCPVLPPISGGGSGPVLDTGVSDVAADAVSQLTGTVEVFSGDDFQNSVAFRGRAEIHAEDPAGNDVVTTYDGQNPFLLEGIRFDRQVWVTAIPEAAADEAMTTLTPFDTSRPDPVFVRLVGGSTLDGIYSVLTNPITRTAGKAQIALRFVRGAAAPVPLSGVRVTLAGAEAKIYDTGGGFSDVETETGPLGLALFANVNAVPLPGSEQSVRVEGVASAMVKLRVAADAATFAEIQLSP